MSRHTPGPWAPDYAEHDCPHQDVRIKAGSRGICCVPMDDAPVEDYNREQGANARLIAAAPDLLESLQEMVRWGQAQKTADNSGRFPLERARAAIAKATGGTD